MKQLQIKLLLKDKITIAIIWLLLAGSQVIIAKEIKKPLIENRYNTYVCGDERDKEVLVTISMGQVYAADSLYGFDFLVAYDTNLVEFNEGVYINTFVELCEWKGYNFGFEPGVLRGYGLSNVRMSGDMPLAGFKGKLKTNCPDSIYLRLIDLDFTDEYRYADVKDTIYLKPERKETYDIRFEFENDEIEFLENKTESLNIYASAKAGDPVNVKINISGSDDIEIGEHTIQSEKIELFLNEKTAFNFDYNLDINEDIENDLIMTLNINEVERDTNTKESLTIRPFILNDCNCVDEITGNEVSIKSKKDDTSVEKENEMVQAYFKENSLIVICPVNQFKTIQVFNLKGQKIMSNNNLKMRNEFDCSTMKSGMYLVVLSDGQNLKNKLVLKYN
jgi:hypothetical protein